VTTALALLPAFIATYVALRYSLQSAFLYVYIPSLLAFPSYFYWDAPAGLPEISFHQAAIFAIGGLWFLKKCPGWRFSMTDAVIVALMLGLAYSIYLFAGYKETQNIVFHKTSVILLPYLLGKSLVEPYGLRIKFAKAIIITLLVVAFFSLYQSVTAAQFTFWQSALGRFFGNQGWQWDIQYRWGLVRAAGPYGHAILAGMVMATGFFIQRWLDWSGAWGNWPRGLHWIPLPLGKTLSIAMFFATLLTFVRGPILGLIVAYFIVLLGLTKYRFIYIGLLIAAFFFIGIPLIEMFISYVAIDPADAETRNQETAAYRWKLLQNYFIIVGERFWWGWGYDWPRQEGQKSIDNHFLLIALRHGMVVLSLLAWLLVGTALRLLIRGLSVPVANPPGSCLAFSLIAIYVMYTVSLGTVWLGEQTEPLLFLLLGWTEGYLLSRQEYVGAASHAQTASTVNQPARPFKFRRVL